MKSNRLINPVNTKFRLRQTKTPRNNRWVQVPRKNKHMLTVTPAARPTS